MKKDVRGYVFFTFHYKWLEFKAIFQTVLVRIAGAAKGILIGKKCKFYGSTRFFRHPESIIQINNSCRFRSSSHSNLIGISKRCIISTHSKRARIIIGEKCGMSGVSLMSMESITIGEGVLIGANSVITDCDWHNVNPMKRHKQVEKGKPVVIENNVFIGYSVTVLKGVVIGENSVVGANSVVVSNIPPNSIAAGNPCKVVSQIKF